MSNQRTLPEKVQDIKSTYQQFKELITTPEERKMLADMTGSAAQAVVAGLSGMNPDAYVALVQASLGLHRVLAANDRAALLAAVMANGGSPARIQLEEE